MQSLYFILTLHNTSSGSFHYIPSMWAKMFCTFGLAVPKMLHMLWL